MTALIKFKSSKEQKVVESCKSSIERNFKVGLQLLLLSITLRKEFQATKAYKRYMKGTSRKMSPPFEFSFAAFKS